MRPVGQHPGARDKHGDQRRQADRQSRPRRPGSSRTPNRAPTFVRSPRPAAGRAITPPLRLLEPGYPARPLDAGAEQRTTRSARPAPPPSDREPTLAPAQPDVRPWPRARAPVETRLWTTNQPVDTGPATTPTGRLPGWHHGAAGPLARAALFAEPDPRRRGRRARRRLPARAADGRRPVGPAGPGRLRPRPPAEPDRPALVRRHPAVRVLALGAGADGGDRRRAWSARSPPSPRPGSPPGCCSARARPVRSSAASPPRSARPATWPRVGSRSPPAWPSAWRRSTCSPATAAGAAPVAAVAAFLAGAANPVAALLLWLCAAGRAAAAPLRRRGRSC